MKKTFWWSVIYIVVGVLLAAGVIFLVTRPPRGNPIILLPAPTPAPITVYVGGSVKQAGLYALPYGSRVNDAIQAAGGFSEQANQGAINLAKMLADGDQVNVPASKPSGTSENGTGQPGPSFDLVDINTATLEQLDNLPEIGPITAQKIIDYRNSNGLFGKTEDLLDVDGIGQGTFDKIKDLITVGTSP